MSHPARVEGLCKFMQSDIYKGIKDIQYRFSQKKNLPGHFVILTEIGWDVGDVEYTDCISAEG